MKFNENQGDITGAIVGEKKNFSRSKNPILVRPPLADLNYSLLPICATDWIYLTGPAIDLADSAAIFETSS